MKDVSEDNAVIEAFLADANWRGASRTRLAGDASPRRYERVKLGRNTAILMISGPDALAAMTAFSRISSWLRSCGLSAPEIYAVSSHACLLLCEDFGDDVFPIVLGRDPHMARVLHLSAVGALKVIGLGEPPVGLSVLDSRRLRDMVEEVSGWYIAAPNAPPGTALQELLEVLEQALKRLDFERRVVSLRDFHAGNLVWLPNRKGARRAGLLDFQDAVMAHPAYDLVSLLQDARLDVAPELEAAAFDCFTGGTGRDPDQLGQAYLLLGIQRGLRILGVFARLARRDKKPAYLSHCARVWSHVIRDGDAYDPAGLGRHLRGAIPEPTPSHLSLILNADH